MTHGKKRGRPSKPDALVQMGPVRVPADVRQELEQIAAGEDRPLASVLRTALRQWLEGRKKAQEVA